MDHSKLSEMDKPHVVVVGNPFDGMTVYGPFPTFHDARTWRCESDIASGPVEEGRWSVADETDSWVVPLESPLSERRVR